MKPITVEDINNYVSINISTFHQKRIARLQTLRLQTVLKKKNPYLFKTKYLLTAEQIIRSITDAFISSNEETIFGDWLEGLALFINQKTCQGWKSGIPGIDLEFDDNGVRYIVTIKSGPNWGNSSQIAKMNFIKAMKTLRTSNSQLRVCCVNGCCYGIDSRPDKGDYFKYCGQKFWEFISGNQSLYTEIIEPLGYKAKEQNSDFQTLYANVINCFTREFANTFCTSNGEIDWNQLLKFNSGDMQRG